MRPMSLRLKNISCFKGDPIFIDFTDEPLSSASLFAIIGPTASGKTTLLDGICVSLYDKTPRLDGKGNKNSVNILNQESIDGFVEFTFEVGGIVYFAEWKANRKTNGVTKRHKIVRVDNNKIVDADTILGMNFEAFRRSIILAQGEFASFLKADKEEKRGILEATTGMYIYDIMKKELNDKLTYVVTNHDTIKYGMDKIPSVTTDDINNAKNRLKLLEEELCKFDDQKSILYKEKSIEQYRYNTYIELERTKKHHSVLESEKEKMENIERDIDRVFKAVGIRSDIEYGSKKTLVDQLKTEKVRIENDLVNKQKKYEESKSIYDTSCNIFEDVKIEVVKKREIYKKAVGYDIEGDRLLKDAKDKQEEVDNIERDIQSLTKIINDDNDQIEKLEIDIENYRKFLEQHHIPDNINEFLVDISRIVGTIVHNNEELDKEITEEENVRLEIQDIEKQLKELVSDVQKNEKEKNSHTKKLGYNNKSLYDFEGDIDYWNSIKYAWSGVRDVGNRFIENYNQFSELFNDKPVLTRHQIEFNDTISTFKNKIEQLIVEKEDAEKNLRYYEEDMKQKRDVHRVSVIRGEYLKKGDACPVCGSFDHPWENKIDTGIEEQIISVDKNLSGAKSDLENVKKRLDERFVRLSGMSKDRVKECEDKITKIGNIYRDNDTITNDLNLIKHRIYIDNEQIESLSKKDKKLIQKAMDINIKIERLKTNISDDRDKFYNIIPVEFRDEKEESALEKFRCLVSEIAESQKMEKECNIKLTGHRISIDEKEKYLKKHYDECDNILKIIDEYNNESDRLLKLVMEITDNLGIDGATKVLDTRLKDAEKQRDDDLEGYNDNKNNFVNTQNKLKDMEKDLGIALQNFKDAESIYMGDLKNAGFLSIEDHKKSFREKSWLEENKNILTRYQHDVSSTKKNIESYEKVFFEKAYNPGDLRDIIENEKSLDKSIKDKSSEKGGVNEEINVLTENLGKRNAQEILLKVAEKEMYRWQKLYNAIPSNVLRDFALNVTFDQLVVITNHQLSDIAPRYHLIAGNMKDMRIIDLDAGEERPVETLSGGESFIISLSLALALSEISIGRCYIQSLFIDEGFGTLDPETLEIVLQTLNSIVSSGRTICIISHVDKLKKDIQVRIDVKPGSGTSNIKIIG